VALGTSTCSLDSSAHGVLGTSTVALGTPARCAAFVGPWGWVRRPAALDSSAHGAPGTSARSVGASTVAWSTSTRPTALHKPLGASRILAHGIESIEHSYEFDNRSQSIVLISSPVDRVVSYPEIEYIF
jgi:hypothetical protein